MSEIKHTPGPWRIVDGFMGRAEIESDNARDNADPTQVYVLARDIGGRIHGEKFDDFSEVEANVKLFAAAPELLAALKRCELLLRSKRHACEDNNLCHLLDSHISQARAAINKATE